MELVLINGEACVKKAVKNDGIYRSIAANSVIGIPEILKIEDGLVFYRYINGETLKSRMENDKHIPKEFIRLFVFSCVKILQELDIYNIVHNKLAPDNIIITPKGKIYIIDFEAAQLKDNKIDFVDYVQNKYTAPELISSNIANASNDIYSIGLILEELDTDNNFTNVIKKCLCDQTKRYSSYTALLHEFNVAYHEIAENDKDIELPRYYSKWMMQVMIVTAFVGGMIGYYISGNSDVSRPLVFTVFCMYLSLVLVDVIDYLRVLMFENVRAKKILKFKVCVSCIVFIVATVAMLIMIN